MLARRGREKLLTYLVVGPFAIVLAYPFYLMAITTFKTNNDLYNNDNNPLIFNDPPTLRNLDFLFTETQYVRWLANTIILGFFKTIPRDLEDAALVDGTSRLGALWRVVLPISLPGILTVVIFTFSLAFNEFVYALTFISSSENKTISIGVPTELIRGDVFFWQGLLAAALIPTPPTAFLYNVFPDGFTRGSRGGDSRGERKREAACDG